MTNLAPVAIFAYRRVGSLGRLLDNLQQCPEYSMSPIFVFVDGPKTRADADDVKNVVDYVQHRKTDNMTINASAQNQGLARSIIDGVTKLTDAYGSVIVLEDDLRLSPLTLSWFNHALRHYEQDDQVKQISGYVHSIPEFSHRADALLLPAITTWGWATWKRVWDDFDEDAAGWEALRTDVDLSSRFDLGGVYPFSKMLINQMELNIDSWGIRFQWMHFVSGGLTVFPPRPFIKNFGVDTKATHGMKSLALALALRGWRPMMKYLPALPNVGPVSTQDLAAMARAIARRAF